MARPSAASSRIVPSEMPLNTRAAISPVDNRSYDYDYLKTCTKPKLFVSGSRDQFATKARLEAMVSSLPEPKKLVIIPAADHFFEGRLREMRETVETWAREVLS